MCRPNACGFLNLNLMQIIGVRTCMCHMSDPWLTLESPHYPELQFLHLQNWGKDQSTLRQQDENSHGYYD